MGAYSQPPIPGTGVKATVGLYAEKPGTAECYDNNYDSIIVNRDNVV